MLCSIGLMWHHKSGGHLRAGNGWCFDCMKFTGDWNRIGFHQLQLIWQSFLRRSETSRFEPWFKNYVAVQNNQSTENYTLHWNNNHLTSHRSHERSFPIKSESKTTQEPMPPPTCPEGWFVSRARLIYLLPRRESVTGRNRGSSERNGPTKSIKSINLARAVPEGEIDAIVETSDRSRRRLALVWRPSRRSGLWTGHNGWVRKIAPSARWPKLVSSVVYILWVLIFFFDNTSVEGWFMQNIKRKNEIQNNCEFSQC